MAVRTRTEALKILEFEVDSNPAEAEIKKSYKRLALQHHPDKNQDNPDATKTFQELGEAYRFLTEKTADEEPDLSFYYDDIDLFELLQRFYELRRPSFINRGFPFESNYGYGSHGYYDDYYDYDPYNLPYGEQPCGYECGHGHSGYSDPSHCNPTAKRGKGRSTQMRGERTPSQKWYRKMMKRQNNADREEYEAETLPKEPPVSRQRDFSCKANGPVYTNPESTSTEEAPSKTRRAKKKNAEQRKSKEPEQPVPKKPSKEEMEAEQERRRKERDETARQIEEQQKREADRELRRQEKERQRQEELRKTSSFSLLDVPQKKSAESKKGEQNKRSGKKKKQAKKTEGKVTPCSSGTSSTTTEWTESEKGNSWEDSSSMPNKKNYGPPNPQQGPGVINTSQKPHRAGPRIYRQDFGNDKTSSQYHSQRPQSAHERSRDNYRAGPREPGHFGGVSRLKSPPRPERVSAPSSSAWGNPRGTGAWGATSTATYKHPPEPSRSGYDDWDESPGFVDDAPGQKNRPPAPAPKENYWRERMEFYQSAVPSSQAEEERMLQAAIELSRLQEEEERLRLKLDEEERLAAEEARVKEEQLRAAVNPPLLQPNNPSSKQSWPSASESWPSASESWPSASESWPSAPEQMRVAEVEDVTPEDEDWSSTAPTTSIPSQWSAGVKQEESRPKVASLGRGVGRGRRHGSRSASVSSDAAPPPGSKVAPEAVAYSSKQDDVWDSTSECDGCEARRSPDSRFDTKEFSVAAEQNPVKVDQGKPRYPESAQQTERQPGALSSDVTGDSNTDHSVLVSGPSSIPVMSGLPSEAGVPLGRGVMRRQYGPRARARRVGAQAASSTVPNIPEPQPASVPCEEPPCQQIPQTAIPDSFSVEDTTEKLRRLCDNVPRSSTQTEGPKKNIFSSLETRHEEQPARGLSPVNTSHCDKQGTAQDRVMPTQLPVFSDAVPLDLRKTTPPLPHSPAPPTSMKSEMNGFGSENPRQDSDVVEDLGNHLGGLNLGGNIWSQTFPNAPMAQHAWTAPSALAGEVQQFLQQSSAPGSETSADTPKSSPAPPDVQENNNKDKVYNPIGSIPSEIGSYLSYNHPYMNMHMPLVMPQMYNMGYQGLPMRPNMGVAPMPVPGSSMMGVPMPGVNMPGRTVPGSTGMPRAAVPNMPGTAMSGTAMPATSMSGPAMPGTAMPGLTAHGPTANSAAMPGAAMPGTSMSGAAMPGMSIPGLSMFAGAMPASAMPGMSMPGTSMPNSGPTAPSTTMSSTPMPGTAMSGMSMHGSGVSGTSMPGPMSGLPMPGISMPGSSMPGISMPSPAMPGADERQMSAPKHNNFPIPGMMPYNMLAGMMPPVPVTMATQGVPSLPSDIPHLQRPKADTMAPTSISDNANSSAGNAHWLNNHFMNGVMPQYGPAHGDMRKEAGSASREQGQGQGAHNMNPQVMGAGMPMMQQGMMPFFPTMPVVPQQYNNTGFRPLDGRAGRSFDGDGVKRESPHCGAY